MSEAGEGEPPMGTTCPAENQHEAVPPKVLDQKEHRLDGHSMNPKSAMTVKKDHVKNIFVAGLSPKAAEERIGSTLASFRRSGRR
ncbi:heterogeneous nuclear ribonucleoprotein A/B-like [Felis catus]|uniref:heterogeneous nuclear ribonucleoprotein A/B-like n=1 Tax=Felis catus TaxID=9685 RepID=UPI001D199553|nr:heterogeneous nuclear ribonucleoprotein A/B-like [Felis catus]